MNDLRTDRWWYAFPTDLGWFALRGAGSRLLRLWIGHSSRDEVQAEARGPGREEADGAPELRRRLTDFAAGRRDQFGDVELDLSGLTPFQSRVLLKARSIPYGTVWSYKQLAERSGCPRGARAVGNAMARNCFPIIVPCHRVIGSDGRLHGFTTPRGLDLKRELLQLEAADG